VNQKASISLEKLVVNSLKVFSSSSHNQINVAFNLAHFLRVANTVTLLFEVFATENLQAPAFKDGGRRLRAASCVPKDARTEDTR
jgi:hypothetical protein